MASTQIGTKTGLLTACCLAGALAAGCQKQRGPNTNQPEDKLLYAWGQALAAGDRDAALKFYDLELRQKLEFWDKTLRPLNDPAKQGAQLAAALPRLGDAAALDTVGGEAWDEVKGELWAQELSDGKCVSGAPSKDDVGRGVIPKERKEMGQELGMWVFDLRNGIGWAPAFRVNCPKEGSFWIQMAKRKTVDPNMEPPLKIVRVGR
jgi:hypothetical protein